MAARVLTLAGLALAASLIGCQPAIPDQVLLCNTNGEGLDNCPGGFTCCAASSSMSYDGVCQRDACDAGADSP